MYNVTEMSQSTSLESLPLVKNINMGAGASTSTRNQRGSFFSSVFALLTTCIGAGTLSLPYAFMRGGLIFSLIVFVVIMVMAIVIGYMLLESKHLIESMAGSKVTINSYADLGEFSFGVIGKVRSMLVSIAGIKYQQLYCINLINTYFCTAGIMAALISGVYLDHVTKLVVITTLGWGWRDDEVPPKVILTPSGCRCLVMQVHSLHVVRDIFFIIR